jgi:hypothetical protein
MPQLLHTHAGGFRHLARGAGRAPPEPAGGPQPWTRRGAAPNPGTRFGDQERQTPQTILKNEKFGREIMKKPGLSPKESQ